MTHDWQLAFIADVEAEVRSRYAGAMAGPDSPKEQYSAKRAKEARAEGGWAFAAGVKFVDKPYQKHPPDHASWMRGWVDADVAGKARNGKI